MSFPEVLHYYNMNWEAFVLWVFYPPPPEGFEQN